MALLIDTSVFIEWERGKSGGLESLASHDIFLAAVTASELLHGVYRADSTVRRERRRNFVEAILARVPVLPFDLEIARVHAQIWSDLQSAGQTIGAHDLQIGATALIKDLTVATHNIRDFRRVPGLNLIEL